MKSNKYYSCKPKSESPTFVCVFVIEKVTVALSTFDSTWGKPLVSEPNYKQSLTTGLPVKSLSRKY